MCKTEVNALKSLTDFAKIAYFSRKQRESGDFANFFHANKKVFMIVAKFAQNFVKKHETSRKFAFPRKWKRIFVSTLPGIDQKNEEMKKFMFEEVDVHAYSFVKRPKIFRIHFKNHENQVHIFKGSTLFCSSGIESRSRFIVLDFWLGGRDRDPH